ncbi:MAG: histidinol-phosphatase [Steroidobacteraceae bacterium]
MSYARHADFPRAMALAHELAEVARSIARNHFRQPITVEHKADSSPVTIADRGIETEMRALIRKQFPSHGIRGEEFGAEAGADFSWVLDPIDGTKSFVTGFPLFGALIALEQQARAVLGIIEAPAMGERWVGVEGISTTFNGASARTSACTTLEQARVYCTSTDCFRGDELKRYEACTRRALLRRYGGDCYIYGLLASGHCDLVIESALKPHDFQALVPVVQGAGGRISDWDGQPLTSQSGERVVAAATEPLWQQAIAALAAH